VHNAPQLLVMQLNAKTGRRIAKNVTKYNKLNKLFTTFFFKKKL